jgi:hypothetical protein
VLSGWKKQWKAFREARPGQRFEDRFERSREMRPSQSWFVRFLKPAAALVLLAGGIVLCFIPGPGLPLIVIGAGLLADESRIIARGMDWIEVRLRKLIKMAFRWWHGASLLAKEAAIGVAMLLASAAAYGGYRFLLAH